MISANYSTGGFFRPAKSQFYNPNGTARDTYIYKDNGGFCPERQAHKIHELGKSL